MSTYKNSEELKAAILLLENKQAQKEIIVKEHLNGVFESIKPINLLRSTFKEMVSTPDFKDDLVNTSLGLASGYLSKKIAIGSTHNPIKLILGSILQMGVTGVVSKHADDIRSKFTDILAIVFKNKPK